MNGKVRTHIADGSGVNTYFQVSESSNKVPAGPVAAFELKLPRFPFSVAPVSFQRKPLVWLGAGCRCAPAGGGFVSVRRTGAPQYASKACACTQHSAVCALCEAWRWPQAAPAAAVCANRCALQRRSEWRRVRGISVPWGGRTAVGTFWERCVPFGRCHHTNLLFRCVALCSAFCVR